MSEKQKSIPICASRIKKQRKAISIKRKMDVIQRFEKGEKAFNIASSMGLPPTTVRTILKNSETIRASAAAATVKSVEVTTKSRPIILEKMEKALSIWINDLNEKNLPVTTLIIQQKATSVFNHLKKMDTEGDKNLSFSASSGWFDRFKKRMQLHNVKITGESASADLKAAKEFPNKFKEIVTEGGYTPQQIFNVDETGLLWKRMPTRTFISKEENAAPGQKMAKDRLTLLLGGNASGDFKLKPLLIYKSETPRAMKNISKETLPVIWRSNKKAWVTAGIFSEWFNKYFCPAVKSYCEKHNLAHKALLLIDNAPGHPVNLDEANDQIKVIFLPPNTTSVLQPMDQGAIAAFKRYYLRRTFKNLIDTLNNELEQANGNDIIRKFWSNFSIMQAIENINKSWQEVSVPTMNKVWRKVWPECISESEDGDIDNPDQLNTEIVVLAHQVGFTDVDESDVSDILCGHEEPLTDDELMELLAQCPTQNVDVERNNTPPESESTNVQFPIRKLSEALSHIDQAVEIFGEYDNDSARFESIRNSIYSSVSHYKDLYAQKKLNLKQKPIESFFNPIFNKDTPGPSSNLKLGNVQATHCESQISDDDSWLI